MTGNRYHGSAKMDRTHFALQMSAERLDRVYTVADVTARVLTVDGSSVFCEIEVPR